ncbi:SMP-30/gluconolactonase/LRE family protein [Buttiauxella gaviniae]|uniref:SMP-30/gluconolactonase/LRE family protein n=1 Tax=Buttiauxella gaviniae TaxID=82990 RepID=UPI003BB638E7
MREANILFDYKGHLPECPSWDVQTQSLFWTDILEKEIHGYQPSTNKHQIFKFSEEVGCFALRENGGFIAAMRSGIYLTDTDGTVTKKVCDNPNNPALARFNDGGTDPQGRFYAGTYWSPRDYNGALLCRVDADLKTTVLQCDILGANGLAFSADGRLMFTSDTPNHVIYRTPLDENGNPGERRVWKSFPRGNGRPDGAAMDEEGCYWSALFDGYRIARFSPQGELLEEHRLPVRCPTMVCFGGPEMKTLFITTTRENMSDEEVRERPLSGAIFTLEASVAGLIKPKFKES